MAESFQKTDRTLYHNAFYRDSNYSALIAAIFTEEDGDVDKLKAALADMARRDVDELARREEDFHKPAIAGVVTPILTRLVTEEKHSHLRRSWRDDFLCSARPFPQDLLSRATEEDVLIRMGCAVVRSHHHLDAGLPMERDEPLLDRLQAVLKDYKGTPLHYAAGIRDLAKARLLLEAGADVQVKDSNQRVALQIVGLDSFIHLFERFRHPRSASVSSDD